MSADHKMLATAAAMPIVSAVLIFLGIFYPKLGWATLIPAILGANLASVVTPKIGSGLATTARVFSWLAAVFLTLTYATTVEPVGLEIDEQDFNIRAMFVPFVIIGVLCSVVAMGLLAKLASDASKSPQILKTAASEKGAMVALSMGNCVVGLVLAYVVVNWLMYGDVIFNRVTGLEKFDQKMRDAITFKVDQVENREEGLSHLLFRVNDWKGSGVTKRQARKAGLTIVNPY